MQFLVPSRVPEELRQTFRYLPPPSRDVVTRAGYLSECSTLFGDANTSKDCFSKYLHTSTGELTRYVAMWLANDLAIFDRDSCQTSYFNFDEEFEVVDVEYLQPSFGKKPSFLVSTNRLEEGSNEPAFVYLLHKTGTGLKIVEKLLIPAKISTSRVLVCDREMKKKSQQFNERMQSWPHVFVIGTRHANCFIATFSDGSAERVVGPNSQVARKTRLTDGLKPFHINDGLFSYRAKDVTNSVKINKQFALEDVEVTSVEFVEKATLLVVGLSFGGLVTISLGEETNITQWMYPCSAPLRHLAYMVPDDDPHGDLWFWAAYDLRKNPSSSPGLTLTLFSVGPNASNDTEEQMKPIEEKKRVYSDPSIFLRLQHSLPHGCKWVSLRTIVRERLGRPEDEETQLDGTSEGANKSNLSTKDYDRSLVMFTYLDKKGSLMGGVFDLNAYYYKRLVTSVVADGTLALQNHFLSVIWPMKMDSSTAHLSNQQIRDAAALPSSVERFVSDISDAEQLFYPSTFSIRLFVAGSKHHYDACVPSIGSQMLSHICSNLLAHLNNPEKPAEWVRALGLVHWQHTFSEHGQEDIDFALVLTALVSSNCQSFLVAVVPSCELGMVERIGNWMWNEILTAKRRMDETIQPLFSRISASLTPEGLRRLRNARTVFHAASELLPQCLEYLKDCPDEVDVETIKTKKAQLAAANDLLSYVSCVIKLVGHGMLPLPADSNERLRTLAAAIAERRRNAAEKGRQLYIDQVVSKMRRLVPDEPFWLGKTATEWYPPALHNLLLPTMVMQLSLRSKQQLLIYYILDSLKCKGMPENITEEGEEEETNEKDWLLKSTSRLLDRIFSITTADITVVFEKWLEDIGEDVNDPYVSSEDDVVAQENREQSRVRVEVDQLIEKGKLDGAEEQKLRELLNRLPAGTRAYKWQMYLRKSVRNAALSQNTKSSSKTATIAQQYINAALGGQKDAGGAPFALTVSPEMRNALRNYSVPQSVADTPQPPIRLFNRRVAAPLRKDLESANAAGGLKRKRTVPSNEDRAAMTTTPPPPEAKRPVQLDETPEQTTANESSEALRRISEVLRTPTSRVKAAAAAEAHLDLTMDTTPETRQDLPAPTSILKSAKSCGKSPIRPKLRFQLPGSASVSPLSPTSFRPDMTGGSLPAPVFDVESDEDESVVDKESTEKTDESSPAGSLEDVAPSDTFVVYTDDADRLNEAEESNIVAPNTEEPEDEEEESDKNGDVQSAVTTSAPLVDYSLNDSTMIRTPDRSIVSRPKPDADGIHRSFEEQPEDDVESDGNEHMETSSAPSNPAPVPIDNRETPILHRSFEVQSDEDSGQEEREEEVPENVVPTKEVSGEGEKKEAVIRKILVEQTEDESDGDLDADNKSADDSVVVVRDVTAESPPAEGSQSKLKKVLSTVESVSPSVGRQSVETVVVRESEVVAGEDGDDDVMITRTTVCRTRTASWSAKDGEEKEGEGKETGNDETAMANQTITIVPVVVKDDAKKDVVAKPAVESPKKGRSKTPSAVSSPAKSSQPTVQTPSATSASRRRTRTTSATVLPPETPTRSSSRLRQRAASEAPIGATSASSGTAAALPPKQPRRKNLFAVDEEEEEKAQPTRRTPSRTRKTPTRARAPSVSDAADVESDAVPEAQPPQSSTRTRRSTSRSRAAPAPTDSDGEVMVDAAAPAKPASTSRPRRSTSRARQPSTSVATDSDVPKSPARRGRPPKVVQPEEEQENKKEPPKSPARKSTRQRKPSESSETGDATATKRTTRKRQEPVYGPDGKQLRGVALFDHLMAQKKVVGSSSSTRTRSNSTSAAEPPKRGRKSISRPTVAVIKEDEELKTDSRRRSRSRSTTRTTTTKKTDASPKKVELAIEKPSSSSTTSTGRKRTTQAAPFTPKRGRNNVEEEDQLPAVVDTDVNMAVTRSGSRRRVPSTSTSQNAPATPTRRSRKTSEAKSDALPSPPPPPPVRARSSRKNPIIREL